MPFIPAAIAFLGTTAGAVTASAVVGAGTALYSSSQQSKAAGQAQQAQNTASQQQLAAQQQALAQATAINQPFVTGGQQAFSQLLQQLGVTQAAQPAASTGKTGSAGVSPTQDYAGSAAPPSGGIDYAKVAQERPDVVAEYQKQHATADPNSPNYTAKGLDSQQNYIDWWANSNKPATDTYQIPTVAAPETATPAPIATTPTPTTPTTPAAPNPMTAAAPSFTTPTYTTPTFASAPTGPDTSAKSFESSPYYQQGLATGQRNLNANSAARGLGQSGSAIEAALQFGQENFAQNYGNWFNQQNQQYTQQLGQYNADRAATLNQFNNDRSSTLNQFNNDRSYGTNVWQNQRDYATNQSNTQTGNLFSLAQIGQNAAGATTGANSSYANNASNIYGSQANAAATAAQQKASANSQLAGSLGGIGSNLFNAFGGSQTPLTAVSPYSIQAAPNPYANQNIALTHMPNVVF